MGLHADLQSNREESGEMRSTIHERTGDERTGSQKQGAHSQAALGSFYSDPKRRFTIVFPAGADTSEIRGMDPYSAAVAFVEGRFQVQGDLVAAVEYFDRQEHPKLRSLWHSILAHLGHEGLDAHVRNTQRRDIQFHYDRSNEFYAQFLDQRMQYSAADFSDARRTLDEAQLEKLQQVCLTLKLQPGERLLDIGCGWGGLAVHAAEQFGVNASGCTLSAAQKEYAAAVVMRRKLEDRVSIELKDYRDVRGRFDKIVSVGMFEHVGRKHLAEYFGRIRELLEEDGTFLNRGIVRPEGVSDGPETLFLQRNVFPGGELAHLADVVREAEHARFEVERMEDFRRHYALTCRAWVARLRQHADACRCLVSERTLRTWLVYLAASAVCFENGTTDAVQVLLRKRPRSSRPWRAELQDGSGNHHGADTPLPMNF